MMFFERAEYWEECVQSALLHVKCKKRPDVRWHRIKKVGVDPHKAEKIVARSQKYLTT